MSLNTWDEVEEAKEGIAELHGKVWSSGAKHTRKVFADLGRNSSEQRSTLRIVHYKRAHRESDHVHPLRVIT